tara:strand:- start:2385 stop:4139 length:1755 start_codon:yes stop_codon:yes gene_type:complete
MKFKMDEASIDGALKTIKENKEKPFDLLAELERKMRELIPLTESQLLMERDLGSLSLVPSVPVSEIGWSTVNTTDQGDVPSEARQQLQQFLRNIQGDDLKDKVKTLSDFYANPSSLMNTGGRKNKSQIIAETLAILTFFKTLTMIITHFNAASAGFSFESFLAVLLDGRQVPTNSQTIADLTTSDGTPISLKLYKEGQLEVGGSFTDLANDIARQEKMQYVSVTKKLTGKDFDQSGTLDFYRFDFNLENIFNIISRSSLKSRNNILLPKPFLDSEGRSTEGLPDKKLAEASPEAMESAFVDALKQTIGANQEAISAEIDPQKFNIENYLQTIDYANNDELVNRKPEAKSADRNKLYVTPLTNIVRQFLINPDIGPVATKKTALFIATLDANQIVRQKFARSEREIERQRTMSEMYFWGDDDKQRLEASRAFYEAASPELKKRCLMVSYGYVNTGHFNLTQKMVESIEALAQPTPGQLFPSGQNSVYIGSIEIGTDKVINMVEQARETINKSIFEIFRDLQSLTQNVSGYFAGGLADDAKADTAIENAKSIGKKTAEVADSQGAPSTFRKPTQFNPQAQRLGYEE